MMRIAGMMIGLEDLLHRKVDLVESCRLLPFAQESVNQDKLLVYEKKIKDKGRLEHIINQLVCWFLLECLSGFNP